MISKSLLRTVFNILPERRLCGSITISSGEDSRPRTSAESAFFQPLPPTRERLLAALGAGALCSVLIAVFAVTARCAGAPIAPGTLGAPPIDSQAAPARHKPKTNAPKGKDTPSATAAGDSKGGTQSSPFGMLKFSADNGPIQIKSDSLSLD